MLQILLYVLQENLEAAVARRPPPGLATVTGVHWAAPVVHAAVALALATLLVTLTRLLRARRHSAAAVERLFAALTRHLLRTGERPGAAPWTPSPLDRLGRQLLRRPPPPLVAG